MEQEVNITHQGISRAVELAEQTASLDLLRMVDSTIDALLSVSRTFDDGTRYVEEMIYKIKKKTVTKGCFLDQDDRAINAFNRAEEALKNILPKMLLKRGSIDKDAELSQDNRHDLHDAYEAWMVSASFLSEALKEIRLCIIAHDLEAEDFDTCPAFDNAEDLIADLHK